MRFSIILKDLNLRKYSYPFDWITKVDQLYDTNIIYNLSLINKLNITDDVDESCKKIYWKRF